MPSYIFGPGGGGGAGNPSAPDLSVQINNGGVFGGVAIGAPGEALVVNNAGNGYVFTGIITNPMPDDTSLVFGTTSPFSITALTSGLSPNGVFTTPTDPAIMVFATEANKAFDFINLALPPGFVPDPIMTFTSQNAVGNELTFVGYDSSSRRFDITASDGDDVNGTANNDNGSSMSWNAGDGGTLGGHGGDQFFRIGTPSPAAGNWNSGHYVYTLKNGTGLGSITKFRTGGDSIDIVWVPPAPNYFRIENSVGNQFLRFRHDGANGIYDVNTGEHRFNQAIDVTGTAHVTSNTGIGVAFGAGTLFRVGSLAQDAAGVRASIGFDDIAVIGNRFSFDARIRANPGANSSCVSVAGNFSAITPANLVSNISGALIGVQSFAIADLNGSTVARLWGSYSGASSTNGGTVTQMSAGVDECLNSNGNIGSVSTRWIKPMTNGGGVITTATSLLLESPGVGAAAVWNLAATGSSVSKFEGFLAINQVTAPTHALTVSGDELLSGKFACGSASVGTNTPFRVGTLAQDGAGIIGSVGETITTTNGTKIGMDLRLRANPTADSTATYEGGRATFLTPANLNFNLNNECIGFRGIAIADMSAAKTVAELHGLKGLVNSTNSGVVALASAVTGTVDISSGEYTTAVNLYAQGGTAGGGVVVGTAYGLLVESPNLGATTQYVAGFELGNSHFLGNLVIGATTPGDTASGVLCLSNAATAPTTSVDLTQIFSKDLSAGNATLAIVTETAVAADVGLASTDSLTVFINGNKYKIPLVLVP